MRANPESSPGLAGPWSEAITLLEKWDPQWAALAGRMTLNPWDSGVLSRKFVELVCVALNTACTALNADATRRHIRAALTAGATKDELVMVFKMGMLLGIHSCSLGAPLLIEEAKAAGVDVARKTAPTPAADQMRVAGQWNLAWDPFVELDPTWTDQAMATGIGVYASGVFTPKEVELLSIALDASYTHMYAPGTRRHIKGALAAGATPEEIMDVLKLCVSQGAQACNLGISILAEELDQEA
jgi:alkylhydroperoxidase/carboxymuconolactone decarboxylase family protein YurZ